MLGLLNSLQFVVGMKHMPRCGEGRPARPREREYFIQLGGIIQARCETLGRYSHGVSPVFPVLLEFDGELLLNCKGYTGVYWHRGFGISAQRR